MSTNPMTLAHAIARELGDGWTARSGHNHGDAYLCGPDNVELHVRFGGYGLSGRIALSGSPSHEEWQQRRSFGLDAPMPDITVSDSKTEIAIAREIRRRLLSRYLPMLAELRERKQAHDDYEARRDALVRELLDRMPGSDQHQNTGADRINLPHSERLYGWVQVYEDGASFDVRARTREAALILADAIATISKAAA